jgi:hypothetical protein
MAKSISPYEARATVGGKSVSERKDQREERGRTTRGDGDDDDELARLHLLEAEEDGHPKDGNLERGTVSESGKKNGDEELQRTEVNALSLRGIREVSTVLTGERRRRGTHIWMKETERVR